MFKFYFCALVILIASCNFNTETNSVSTPPVYHHGDQFTLSNPIIGNNTIQQKAFSGGVDGIVETLEAGSQLLETPGDYGWKFTQGAHAPYVFVDNERGKVMYSDFFGQNDLDATKGFGFSLPIPENTWIYYTRVNRYSLKTKDGNDYPVNLFECQLKMDRFINTNSISDTNGCELVFFNWLKDAGKMLRIENTMDSAITEYGSDQTSFPEVNKGWQRIEWFIFTGTVSGNDGSIIMRTHKNGSIQENINLSNITLYGSEKRYQWIQAQDYFGNFGTEASLREVFCDDIFAQVGSTKRIVLSDAKDINRASIYELQDWALWENNTLKGKINIGAIKTSGVYYISVINHTDIVLYSEEIYLKVP